MDQELMDAAAYVPSRRFVCTQQVAALVYMDEVMLFAS